MARASLIAASIATSCSSASHEWAVGDGPGEFVSPFEELLVGGGVDGDAVVGGGWVR